MVHEVFISYSREDLAAAQTVCSALESAAISCWIAPRDIPVGSDYAEALLDAVLASRLVVLIFSGHANESNHVVREIERAVSNKIIVVPLRIEDVRFSKRLQYFLSGVQHFDALEPELQSRLDDFVSAVAALLAKPIPLKAKSPRRPLPWKRVTMALAAIVALAFLVRFAWKAYCWTAAQMAFAEGNTDLQYQRLPDAVSKFTEAVRFQPAFGRAYVNRSSAFYQMGQYALALQDLNTAIGLEPGIASDLVARATVEEQIGDHRPAVRDLTQAIALAPAIPDYHYYRAISSLRAEDYRSAIADLDECIRLSPRSAAYHYRGVVYNRVGEYDRAAADFGNAIAMDGANPNPDSYKERAVAWTKLGKTDLALRDRAEAIRLYKLRGGQLQSMGNRSAADEALRQAAELQSR